MLGAQYISKFDLRLGNNEILVKEKDKHNTEFRTYQGYYEWWVNKPFVHTKAPTTFQKPNG